MDLPARSPCWPLRLDSIAVSVFADIFIELTNTETAATTLWERLQNLWRASAQGKVLESGVFWWISYPTHMKSMLSGFLGSQVHHRRAERGVSITLPSLRQSNFGKLQFGFVLADFQISPTLKLYFWSLFRPALHKMSQIKCNFYLWESLISHIQQFRHFSNRDKYQLFLGAS